MVNTPLCNSLYLLLEISGHTVLAEMNVPKYSRANVYMLTCLSVYHFLLIPAAQGPPSADDGCQ